MYIIIYYIVADSERIVNVSWEKCGIELDSVEFCRSENDFDSTFAVVLRYKDFFANPFAQGFYV